MKKIILFLAVTISTTLFAQVPQGISYQAIALNTSGNPVVSSNVGLRLSILDNSATGTVLYTETHVKTTNAQGLFNLVIGQGTVTTGTFSTINWATNTKFLKVEMDVAGGSNYVLVGSTQLLSVPYALAADSLVTSPGEGITLVSPNGTPYQVTVNDSGQLSLPTSGTTGTIPSSLYMYGSFNSFNAATSLLLQINFNGNTSIFYGYKYLTSGTQLKFLPANNSSAQAYGLNGALYLSTNGNNYNVASNGFYLLSLRDLQSPYNITDYQFNITSGVPNILIQGSNLGTIPTTSYNSANNTISYIVSGVTSNSGSFYFNVPIPFSVGNINYGDQFNDGTIDLSAPAINFPGANLTPKNYKIDLVLNFNGSGTYTITQIP